MGNDFQMDDSKDGDKNRSSTAHVNKHCGYWDSLSLS
jgi:hypothetical protein